MNLYTGEIVALILNGLIIAVVITFPVWVGYIALSVFRKSMKKDRELFETKVISLLEQIREAQVVREKQS